MRNECNSRVITMRGRGTSISQPSKLRQVDTDLNLKFCWPLFPSAWIWCNPNFGSSRVQQKVKVMTNSREATSNTFGIKLDPAKIKRVIYANLTYFLQARLSKL